MSVIHFLNVLEGDCNIIQHDSGRISVIDVCNAYNDDDTPAEKAVQAYKKKILFDTKVPVGKIDFKQKADPDNPIKYIKNRLQRNDIFRFIITHPDMDHLDGIKDFYNEFTVTNTWDSDNTKELPAGSGDGRYNRDDWDFYRQIREGKYSKTYRLTYSAGADAQYFNEDMIKVLCPTTALIRQANEIAGDFHDLSYVLLYTPPTQEGGHWKILFAGDSHDSSWEYILRNHRSQVENVDILFAPHHGRDSGRDYKFLDILKPKLTLFGNASSEHLAYSQYRKTRITNNQAGHIILDINPKRSKVYVKNQEFASSFLRKRSWPLTALDPGFQAYPIIQYNA